MSLPLFFDLSYDVQKMYFHEIFQVFMQWHSIVRAEGVVSVLDQIWPARYLPVVLSVN
jgi:hypothetical protein